MNTFHLATIPLAEPVTIYLPPAGMPRARILRGGVREPIPGNADNGEPTTFAELQVAFWINVVTQTVHAQIAGLPHPLLIYSAEDFAAVAADLPTHHSERVLQLLGTAPAEVLQALADGTEMPARPPRIPRVIRAWQGREILRRMGLLATVQSLVEQLADTAVTEAWEARENLARRGRTVLSMAAALGLSEAQVDELFISAAALEV